MSSDITKLFVCHIGFASTSLTTGSWLKAGCLFGELLNFIKLLDATLVHTGTMAETVLPSGELKLTYCLFAQVGIQQVHSAS